MNGRGLIGVWAAALVTLSAGCDKEEAPAEAGAKKPYRPPAQFNTYPDLCRDPATGLEGAPVFDGPESDGPNKFALYERRDGADEYDTILGKDRQLLQPWIADTVGDVELVVCVDRTKKQKVWTCNYDGGRTIDLHDAEDRIRIIETGTGKVLVDETVVHEHVDDCPQSALFGGDSWDMMAEYDDELISLMMEHQPKGTPPLSLQTSSYLDLKNVCGGIPNPRAGAYDPEAPGPRNVYVTYRPTERGRYDYRNHPSGLFYATPDADRDDLSKYQLVACVTGKPAQKERDCAFDGGVSVGLFAGEVEVVVREARTAKIVETKSFEAKGGDCPYGMTIAKGDDSPSMLAKVEPAFVSMLDRLVK